jgi:transcriptional regulator with XRE-family HTH domain
MGIRELGAYVRDWRKAHQLTQVEMGQLIGTSHTYVSKIEQGRSKSPGYDVLRNLARGMGVPFATVDALLRDEHPSRAERATPEMTREVPVVAHVSAGPGSGDVVDYVYVGLSEIQGRLLKAVVVQGDCLAPQIPSGSLVIIDVSAAADVRDGQIVAATLLDTGDHVLKRFYQLGSKVRLEPNIGQPIIVDVDRVRIEGVATEIRQYLNR